MALNFEVDPRRIHIHTHTQTHTQHTHTHTHTHTHRFFHQFHHINKVAIDEGGLWLVSVKKGTFPDFIVSAQMKLTNLELGY